MRYPVGARATWSDAWDAARDSVRLTGGAFRYRVFKNERTWYFQPRDAPDQIRHQPFPA